MTDTMMHGNRNNGSVNSGSRSGGDSLNGGPVGVNNGALPSNLLTMTPVLAN